MICTSLKSQQEVIRLSYRIYLHMPREQKGRMTRARFIFDTLLESLLVAAFKAGVRL